MSYTQSWWEIAWNNYMFYHVLYKFLVWFTYLNQNWTVGLFYKAALKAAYLRRHLPSLVGIVTLAAQTSGTRNAKHLQACRKDW